MLLACIEADDPVAEVNAGPNQTFAFLGRAGFKAMVTLEPQTAVIKLTHLDYIIREPNSVILLDARGVP